MASTFATTFLVLITNTQYELTQGAPHSTRKQIINTCFAEIFARGAFSLAIFWRFPCLRYSDAVKFSVCCRTERFRVKVGRYEKPSKVRKLLQIKRLLVDDRSELDNHPSLKSAVYISSPVNVLQAWDLKYSKLSKKQTKTKGITTKLHS